MYQMVRDEFMYCYTPSKYTMAKLFIQYNTKSQIEREVGPNSL